MGDDPRLRWQLANPYGIQIDDSGERWWSGRVFDLAELDGGSAGLLVGTETGGVWSLDADNNPLPLSNDWDSPDVNCLAAGPDGPRHFFAGCRGGVIYETDASHPTPLLAWAPIADALPKGGGAIAAVGALPAAGDVYDIAVLHKPRIIVAACAGGLFWSEIPKTPPWWCVLAKLPPASGARPPFKWRQADVENFGQTGYFSIALGTNSGRALLRGEEDLKDVSLVVGGTSGGVFAGGWSGGTLKLKRVKIVDGAGADLTAGLALAMTGASAVAACAQFPHHLYATAAHKDGRLAMILRSKDGGRTWTPTKNDLKGAGAVTSIVFKAGDQGAGGAPNNCIAVAPSAPGVVAFGWQDGTFISPNAGDVWLRIGAEVHHADVHVLQFLATTPDDKHLLYIGSDGGLAQVSVDDALGGAPLVARSDYNRRLATLQCYSTWVTRQFYGTMSVSPVGTGWVASGIHDNGNNYFNAIAGTPWQHIDGGDGGWNVIVRDGGLVRNILAQAAQSAQAYATGFVDKGTIPIAVPAPGDPKGVISPFGDTVRQPSYRNAFGQTMFAAAGAAEPKKNIPDVYGLFQDGPEQTYHWELLGAVPDNLQVSATGSFRGGTVLVGAGAGRIFALDSKLGTTIELPIVLPKPAPDKPQSGGGFCRIAVLRDDIAFAILNGTNQGNCYIIRLDGLKWIVPPSIGLPSDQAFYGLDGFLRGDKAVLFAATDDRVYLSEDSGDTWVRASLDLPRRPHCADLRVGTLERQPVLFLSTFGRSVWRADLGRLQPH